VSDLRSQISKRGFKGNIEVKGDSIMDELVKQVAQRTGISEENARTAVTTVLSFLKDKLPAPIAGQIDSVVGGGQAETGGGIGDVASAVGGLLK
jgi:hypothetical protein